MKKIIAAIFALSLFAGVAAPAFAAEAEANCPYINKSMCEVSKSLLDSTTEDE